jgi:hypothetical protein
VTVANVESNATLEVLYASFGPAPAGALGYPAFATTAMHSCPNAAALGDLLARPSVAIP